MPELNDHDLVSQYELRHIKYERRPVRDRKGTPIEGLHQAWIMLDNEAQLNSYTTAAVKDVILGFRRASNDRRCVAVVFTGAGTRRGRSSTCSTCASSTTWSRTSCSATSRSSAA